MLNIEDKQGYKYTEEFGYIPEDWEVVKIRDVAQIYGRIGFRGYTKDDIVSQGYGAISLSPTNIKENGLLYNDSTYISWYKYEESPEIKIYNGDILLVKTGSSYGKSSIVEHLPQEATINPQLIVFKNLKVNNKFFAYILKTKEFIEQIEKIVVGGAIPTLSQEQIYNFNTICPSLNEQEKIAEVLGDVDSLIDKTQQLINKKKDLKTATMQKLLTPKEDWDKYIIGQIGSTYSGLSGKNKEDFGNGDGLYIPFLNIMNNPFVDVKAFEKVNIKNNESQNTCLKNDLFFNTSSETPEEVGMCATLQEDIPNLYLNSFCFGYRLKQISIVNSMFLVYLFRANYGRTIMQTLAQGSTRYNLPKDKFMEHEIFIPKYDKQEQIVSILSDMDSEIEALEKELNKYKDLKTGMMQQLLTGKVRLI